MENKIKLYQFEDCSFCEKVRAKLEELGFEYGKINVPRDRESAERKMLFEKSGVYSIPILEIDGKFIGESSVIIKKLEEIKGIKHESFFTKLLSKLKLTKSTSHQQ